MVNVKSQARGMSNPRGGSAPTDEDPFAELADIFESELKFDARFADDAPAARRPVTTPRREPALDLGTMEREFQNAFENEMRSTRAAPAAAPRKAGRAQPTHLTDEEIDNELESVLRNLSAPARPRDRIVVETQSFAPAREIEERIPQAPSLEVDEFEELIRSELAVIRPAMPVRPAPAPQAARAFDENYVEEAAYADDRLEPKQGKVRLAANGNAWKGRLKAGASAAVFLLLAGAGYTVWQNGPAGVGSSEDPLLIKADAEPYKIVPKDPGGRAYPNQNKAVYERVASSNKADGAPVQKVLDTNVEEPMDIPAEEPVTYADNLPGVELVAEGEGQKDETRVSEATETDAAAAAVLQPRKVKTMTVGPDGRFVADETPAANANAKPAAQVIEASAPDLSTMAVASIAPAAPMVEAKPAPAPKAAAREEAPAPVQTAAAMPSGGYFVQVASQPSEAAAQQSLRNIGARHGGTIGSRQLGIQPAEIPGKGTFYRVRVAASSKEEASSLCSQLKSAGASCFVTR